MFYPLQPRLQFTADQNANTHTYSANAAKDALSDKMDESGHDAKAEAHKQNV